jgi:adenylate cyclase
MSLLHDYHAVLGKLVFAYDGTLEHFEGDGLMVFFNDPAPCPDAPVRAVCMALEMRRRVADLSHTWRELGHQLEFGVGIAQGYATLGPIGFEGRWDYAAIGTLTNVAAQLCSLAGSGQILISPRVRSALGGRYETRSLGAIELKGLARPVDVHEVIGEPAI